MRSRCSETDDRPKRGRAIRLCFIGYGSIAHSHAKTFRQLGGVTFDSVVGRLPERSAEFAAQYGFPFHTTRLAEALERECDAVVICSPSDLHAEQAEAALNAGKHVLVEIPIATNYPDAERVTRLAEERGLTLMVCHTQRFFPVLREARRRIETGAFHPRHLVMHWFFLRRENVNWEGRQRSWTDNLLWHHACHVVDAALWLLGATDAEVVGWTAPPSQTLGIPLDLNIGLKTPRGELVTIAMSYNSHWSRHDYLLIGDEDTWLFEGGRLRNEKGVIFEGGESAGQSQNAEFLAAVREGREPSVSGRSVLPAMRVLRDVEKTA